MDIQQTASKIKIVFLYILGFVLFLLVLGVMSIRYVIIGGEKYDKSARTLVISDSNIVKDDYSVLNEFTQLEKLDISALNVTVEEYDSIASKMGDNITIRWNVPIGNSKVPSDSESLSITDEMLDDEKDILSYFHNLKQLEANDISSIERLYEVIHKVKEINTDVSCTYSTNLYGVPIDTSCEEVNLNNIPIKKTDKVKMAVELFPNVKKYKMCDCGLTDDEMAQLRNEYPEIDFVWMLHVLIYDIPTDVQVFSTLLANWVAYGDENTFAPIFKYCTDLRALDLGHWDHIGDISEIRNLKNLEILIISDNSISDLTPLSELKHLKYADLRYNQITDVTPLTSLQELQFLEIGGNKLTNAEKLCECKSLKYLYIEDAVVPTKTIEALQKGLPDGCEFKMKNTRGHRWYIRIIGMFRKWKKVKVYHDWENVEYYD